jgi:hypothetical protein
MMGEENEKSYTAMAYLIKGFALFVAVGVIALFGKLFYGMTDASQETITDAASTNQCMKQRIHAYSPEIGAISKSTLWGYERECKLIKEYQYQTQNIHSAPKYDYCIDLNGYPGVHYDGHAYDLTGTNGFMQTESRGVRCMTKSEFIDYVSALRRNDENHLHELHKILEMKSIKFYGESDDI